MSNGHWSILLIVCQKYFFKCQVFPTLLKHRRIRDLPLWHSIQFNSKTTNCLLRLNTKRQSHFIFKILNLLPPNNWVSVAFLRNYKIVICENKAYNVCLRQIGVNLIYYTAEGKLKKQNHRTELFKAKSLCRGMLFERKREELKLGYLRKAEDEGRDV